MRILRATLITVGTTQILGGAMLLCSPATYAGLLHLGPAPAWVNWLLAMAGARFIGYGIGMFSAVRAPWRHRLWIDTMIAIQVVDFTVTLGFTANGVLPFGSFSPAVVVPLAWVALLGGARLHGLGAATPTSRVGDP